MGDRSCPRDRRASLLSAVEAAPSDPFSGAECESSLCNLLANILHLSQTKNDPSARRFEVQADDRTLASHEGDSVENSDEDTWDRPQNIIVNGVFH